jgi:hypothetical protein
MSADNHSTISGCSQPASARALVKHSARADAGWEHAKEELINER